MRSYRTFPLVGPFMQGGQGGFGVAHRCVLERPQPQCVLSLPGVQALTTLGRPLWMQEVIGAQRRVEGCLSDGIVATCASKTCHREDDPPQNCTSNAHLICESTAIHVLGPLVQESLCTLPQHVEGFPRRVL